MTAPMDDDATRARIEELEREERALRTDESEAAAEHREERIAEDAMRLEALRVELDRLWDYLRQRRALREAGEDPDGAQMRDSGTVEDYLG